MDIDVSAVTSHFPNPQDGFTTTTSGSVSSGAATVGLNSTGNYDNGDIVVLIIDPADANKKQVFVGTIDTGGVQVTNVVWVGGTNQSHQAGATVVDYMDAGHIKMMTKGIRVSLNQDGTIKNGAVSLAAMLASNVVTEPKILDGAVTTDKLADDGVTAAKMLYGMVRGRQGGAAGDASWQTQGTTNVDTSAKSAFIQCGSIQVSGTSGTEVTVTFPNAFNFAPIVIVSSASAGGANVTSSANTIGTTTFKLRQIFSGGGSQTETHNWIAIGQ